MQRMILLLSLAASLSAQRFFPDDPLSHEPSPRPVDQAFSRKLSDYYDLFSNQFGEFGERQPKAGKAIPAMDVNTLGEPMDGPWYVKRHYYQRMSREELIRGAGQAKPPSMAGPWTVVAAKTEGVTPGFTIIDAERRRYFIKFDPMTNPEMATAADSISARFFHALGYNVPENYLVYFTADRIELGPGVQVAGRAGRLRPMIRDDIGKILSRVPRTAQGTYRATASLAVEGKPIGPPRYYGTRADDPNDVVPHEHRRELRGLQVFCAWLDHDDSRAINNLDTLVTVNGVQFVRHYLLDFGSTLGSASSGPNSPRSGAYFFSWKNSAIQLFTLGLKPPYWAFADYPDYPSIGRFEWKVFDPEKWVPEYPNAAFLNRLPDDEFWAAKQVMAFTDDDIAAIVSTGQLSDPEAAAYLTGALRKRRDKIGKAYFTKVLPFDRFRADRSKLVWDDLSLLHGIDSIDEVQVSWSRFDNDSQAKTPIPGATGTAIPAVDGYFAADLSSPQRPTQSVTVYLRRHRQSVTIVGIDRAW